MATTDEIVVRFKSEGGATVEEAFKRVGAAADKVNGSTDRVGRSIDGLRLKTEGRVASNIGAIAQSFASGGSAADIFAQSVTRLSESFRGSLLFAGAATAGIGLYEVITRTGEAMIKLNSEVAALTRPRGSANFLGTDSINKDLTDIGNKIEEIYSAQVQRSNSFLASGAGFLPFNMGPAVKAAINALNASDQEKINKLQHAAVNTIEDLAKKTENLNRVEYERTHISKLQADLDESEIKHQERLGALARTAVLAGVSGQPALNQENIRAGEEQANLRRAAGQAAFQTPAQFGESLKATLSSLLRPVDPKLVIGEKEQLAKDASALATQAFREGDKAESERLNRIRDTLLGEAQDMKAGQEQLKTDANNRFGAIGKGDYSGIASLIGADYSGLRSLSGVDYTGLKSLGGLSISIK